MKASDMRVDHGDRIAESLRPDPVRIDVDAEWASTLTGLSKRAHVHDLSLRTDCHVAVGAIVRAGHDLRSDEGTDLPQSRDRRSRGNDRASGVEHQPGLIGSGRDGGLVDESEQPAVVAVGPIALRRIVDVGDYVERHAFVGAQGHRHDVRDRSPDQVQIGHEEVPVLVERETRVAAGAVQRVIGAGPDDSVNRPGGPSVETYGLEQSRGSRRDIRFDHDVARIRWVDRHRLLGLVTPALADVNVDRGSGRHGFHRATRRGRAHPEEGDPESRHASEPNRPWAHTSFPPVNPSSTNYTAPRYRLRNWRRSRPPAGAIQGFELRRSLTKCWEGRG